MRHADETKTGLVAYWVTSPPLEVPCPLPIRYI
jgi:hypothetical protein